MWIRKGEIKTQRDERETKIAEINGYNGERFIKA